MCTKLVDNIILFNVSGVPIKISTETLARHPDSLLTTMANNKVQPVEGWFVECCPELFGCILRFMVHNIQIQPSMVAQKMFTTETEVRRVIDGFKFKRIYATDSTPIPIKEPVDDMEPVVTTDSVNDMNKYERELYDSAYKKIWSSAHKGKLSKLKLLAEKGYDLDVKCQQYGSTPLMYAAQRGKLDCVTFLIERGVNVNATNNKKYTALDFAEENDEFDIVTMLLKNGTNVTDKNALFRRALNNGSESLILELLEHGIDINSRDSEGQTPLYFAIVKNLTTVVNILIAKGADINARNNDGQTPLHKAVMHSRTIIVDLLLAKGVEINTRTNMGNTPLHSASSRSLDLVKALLKSGADPNAKNDEGNTPLLIASMKGKHDIVVELHEHMCNKS
jgi:ankyrin repeat protein